MFYSEYQVYNEKYKQMGIQQFISLFKSHNQRKIERKQLHWGEEIEYTLFYFDPVKQKVQLANQGYDLIQEFNNIDDSEIHLHPEFGNWMVEAVPTDPYGCVEDLSQLLSCIDKISRRYYLYLNDVTFRRQILD